ncbi:hypothetical protein MKZ38_000780 [Zalerion maritima]|uniref:Tafazzin n=1 Tax=Zalerion maritima TaxID=339359 RepID=A0AAD5RG23_9PEZI|nr:hypothetical protein MKZ38_000780 [Zalerion maritima]
MPPLIREILQLPETTPPRPRRLQARTGPDGRALPPGPPPPASWVSAAAGAIGARRGGRVPFALDPSSASVSSLSSSLSQLHLTTTDAGHHVNNGDLFPRLPGTHRQAHGSLVEISMREMAHTWSFQRSFNRYYLYSLPGSLRSGLIATLCRHHIGGVTLADLHVLLTAPDFSPGIGDAEAVEVDWEEEAAMNDDFHELDLSGCLGRTITLRDLSTFLFSSSRPGSDSDAPTQSPRRSRKGKTNEVVEEVKESWEMYLSSPSPAPSLKCTLPYLTHLSLGLPPASASKETKRYNISWKQLLSIASRLPSLTHLSLANWPTPALTTGHAPSALPFLHASDPNPSQRADLAEAVLVFRKLSKYLYGLQYLDLSGCSEWWEVLRHSVETSSGELPDAEPITTPSPRRRADVASLRVLQTDAPSTSSGRAQNEDDDWTGRDGIDWVGDWGKVETVVMKSGLFPNPPSLGDTLQFRRAVASARSVERHVRSQRLGRGRWFSAERDPFPDWWSETQNKGEPLS